MDRGLFCYRFWPSALPVKSGDAEEARKRPAPALGVLIRPRSNSLSTGVRVNNRAARHCANCWRRVDLNHEATIVLRHAMSNAAAAGAAVLGLAFHAFEVLPTPSEQRVDQCELAPVAHSWDLIMTRAPVPTPFNRSAPALTIGQRHGLITLRPCRSRETEDHRSMQAAAGRLAIDAARCIAGACIQ